MTKIVDQRINMEDNEKKDDADKGIPWLIESLKEKKKTGNPPWRPGAESSEAIQGQQHGKRQRQRTAQLSKQKKGKSKGKNQTKENGKGKSKDKQKSTKGKGKDKDKRHRETTQKQMQNEWEMKRRKQKQKKKHDFHMCTSTEGTTRAFPNQRQFTLMARQEDHEARNL